MTKDEIKLLCEANLKLEWWAMILFAEITELVNCEQSGYTEKELYPLIKSKVAEFPRVVMQDVIERAKAK